MNDMQLVALRQRMKELQSIADCDRTDEQWDELSDLEISLSHSNRIGMPMNKNNSSKKKNQNQNQNQKNTRVPRNNTNNTNIKVQHPEFKPKIQVVEEVAKDVAKLEEGVKPMRKTVRNRLFKRNSRARTPVANNAQGATEDTPALVVLPADN